MKDENNLNAEMLGDSGEHSSKSTGADSEKISVMDYCINRLTAITQELNKFKFNNDITDEWLEEILLVVRMLICLPGDKSLSGLERKDYIHTLRPVVQT